VARFVVAGLALAALAVLVGEAIEQIGEHLGPGPTGLLQSSLGNLPELMVAIFALRKGSRQWSRPRWWVPSWAMSCWCWEQRS